MHHDLVRQPLRRLLGAVRAVGQGLLGMALIALAALAFLPGAHAAAPVALENQALPAGAAGAGTPPQHERGGAARRVPN